MSILYRPVLIETVEQAEALLGKTPILTLSPEGETWEACLREDIDGGALTPSDGWTCFALVPIEAEEVRVIASGGLERDYHGATALNRTPDGPRRDYRRTEFHTPWEDA